MSYFTAPSFAPANEVGRAPLACCRSGGCLAGSRELGVGSGDVEIGCAGPEDEEGIGFLEGMVVEVGFRGGKAGFSGFILGLGAVGVCVEG